MIYIKIIMKYHKHKDLNAPPLALGLEKNAVSEKNWRNSSVSWTRRHVVTMVLSLLIFNPETSLVGG